MIGPPHHMKSFSGITVGVKAECIAASEMVSAMPLQRQRLKSFHLQDWASLLMVSWHPAKETLPSSNNPTMRLTTRIASAVEICSSLAAIRHQWQKGVKG